MRSLPTPPVLLITDGTQALHPLKDVIRASFEAGVRWVGIREKAASDGAQAELVRFTQMLHPQMRVMLFGSVAVAKRCKAHGVHLDRTGDVARTRAIMGKHALIGKSCHDEAEILSAEVADYITLSPAFETVSKPGYEALGLDAFRALAAKSKVPVLGLGGIEAENGASVIAAGASGVAVMGSIIRAEDPKAAMNAILSAVTRSL